MDRRLDGSLMQKVVEHFCLLLEKFFSTKPISHEHKSISSKEVFLLIESSSGAELESIKSWLKDN